MVDPSMTATREDFDHRFLALCRTHRLPAPLMHAHVHTAGDLLEVDMLWPRHRVCVELDGGQVHRTRRAFERDRRRDLALAAEGYVVVRLTWRRLTTDAARVGTELGRVLARRLHDEPASIQRVQRSE